MATTCKETTGNEWTASTTVGTDAGRRRRRIELHGV